MDQAEACWRAFLQDEVPHPGEFEQHLLIFDMVESTTIPELPINTNRFMTARSPDIVGSDRSLMTFAKLGRFWIFPMGRQQGQRQAGSAKARKAHRTCRARPSH
jgi:hypothetical protein